MKKYWLILLILCFSSHFAVTSDTASRQSAEPFFALGNRVFSRAEAALFLPPDCKDARSWIIENLPAIATFVLCEQADIHLSEPLTRQMLNDSLLLMSSEQRLAFDSMIKANKLTPEQWLERESKKLDNQLTEAVRRWYIKVHGSKNPITSEHIQNWYYRHMNLFRRTTLDPEKFYTIDPAKPENIQKILDALRQGMTPAAAAKLFAVDVKLEEITDDLQKNIAQKQVIEENFWKITGEKYIYLMRSDARKHIYLTLDKNLQRAIGDALYDALAKAILSETLKQNSSPEQLRFY